MQTNQDVVRVRKVKLHRECSVLEFGPVPTRHPTSPTPSPTPSSALFSVSYLMAMCTPTRHTALSCRLEKECESRDPPTALASPSFAPARLHVMQPPSCTPRETLVLSTVGCQHRRVGWGVPVEEAEVACVLRGHLVRVSGRGRGRLRVRVRGEGQG